jgi:HAMP domain-containing protein
MALRIRHIATRFALLLASAAVAPLLVYGFVSLVSLQRGTRDSVITGNQNVATRAAEEIRRYLTTNAQMLKALAANLQETGLQTWQQERSLKNYILRFREFRELALLDETGAVIASSSVGAPAPQIPTTPSLLIDGVAMSPIRLDKDRLPTAVFGIHLARESGVDQRNQPRGNVAMVDRITWRPRLARSDRAGWDARGAAIRPQSACRASNWPATPGPLRGQRRDRCQRVSDGGVRKLGVATGIRRWVTVIVEQPDRRGHANATQLERQLFVAISVALLVMLTIGLAFGRSFISPIRTLQRATQAVASGQLEARVDIRTGDEFSVLGDAFNTMANRLVQLQKEIKLQERQATIGRIASGLVHDLTHPIANLGNNRR